MTELQEVPTVLELHGMGDQYAVAVAWTKEGKPTQFRVTALGHAHLGAIMRSNAEIRVARGEGRWERPPSRQIGGLKNAP